MVKCQLRGLEMAYAYFYNLGPTKAQHRSKFQEGLALFMAA